MELVFFLVMGFIIFISFSAENFFCFLIGVEGIMVSFFLEISSMVGASASSFVTLILFTVMVVVEGVIGVSVLVYSVFLFGEDYFYSISTY